MPLRQGGEPSHPDLRAKAIPVHLAVVHEDNFTLLLTVTGASVYFWRS